MKRYVLAARNTLPAAPEPAEEIGRSGDVREAIVIVLVRRSREDTSDCPGALYFLSFSFILFPLPVPLSMFLFQCSSFNVPLSMFLFQ